MNLNQDYLSGVCTGIAITALVVEGINLYVRKTAAKRDKAIAEENNEALNKLCKPEEIYKDASSNFLEFGLIEEKNCEREVHALNLCWNVTYILCHLTSAFSMLSKHEALRNQEDYQSSLRAILETNQLMTLEQEIDTLRKLQENYTSADFEQELVRVFEHDLLDIGRRLSNAAGDVIDSKNGTGERKAAIIVTIRNTQQVLSDLANKAASGEDILLLVPESKGVEFASALKTLHHAFGHAIDKIEKYLLPEKSHQQNLR